MIVSTKSLAHTTRGAVDETAASYQGSDGRRQVQDDGVGVTQVESQLVARDRRAVPNADEDELLAPPRAHALQHVAGQRAAEP